MSSKPLALLITAASASGSAWKPSAAAALAPPATITLPAADNQGSSSARSAERMTPPTWLDAHGRRRPTQACWTCGREVAPMRFRAEHLRPHGWAPPQTLHIPDWCDYTTEYLPVPVGHGWWQLVPIWEPDQTVNPLRRYAPPEPR